MPLPSFALLDDNHPDSNNPAAGPATRSRLYTGLQTSLSCPDAAGLPALLEQMQSALQQGSHALVLLRYELGAQLLRIDTAPVVTPNATTSPMASEAAAEILIFSQCRHLTPQQSVHWLQQQAGAAIPAVSAQPSGIAGLQASVDEAQFAAAIARIHDYIAAGDTYQVNYTYRLHFDAYGHPLALYNKLRARQPAPYSALICLPDQRYILSFSPELFIRHQQGQLRAQPMKGTAPAMPDSEPGHAAGNRQRAQQLAADEKNRAENLMIVDLLRNDLGRIAVNGSVAVPQLFSVTRFGQVLQMTSTVTAQLHPAASLIDVIGALYPCGSITGAPKRRTMQIIKELESTPRGLYTGAIGWFEAAPAGRLIGDFCLSVPIRTLLLQAPENTLPHAVRRGEMGVGAGIVHDSRAPDEYKECALKARFLTELESDFSLFETMYATREHGCRHLPLHLQRLRESAAYFNFRFDSDAITAALGARCLQLPPATPVRLRLDLHRDGRLHVQHGILTPLAARVKLLLATQTRHSGDLWLRHKSSCRAIYDQAWQQAEQHGAFDMLFFNQYDELTEGGRSNVLVQLDGRWYTPPLAAGLLPGVMRTVLLQDPQWAASERNITRAELQAAQQIAVCNALRGVLPAELINAQ